MGPVAAGRKGRGAGGSLGKAAEGRWKAGVSVFLRASSVVFPGGKEKTTVTRGDYVEKELQKSATKRIVPVNSVNAHNEGLNVGVGGAAELAAGLSAERGAIT